MLLTKEDVKHIKKTIIVSTKQTSLTDTDIFQCNMFDCYLDQPDKTFKLRQYQIIDQFCFAEFLSLYYTDPRPLESTENNCQQAVLNEEIIELNHDGLTLDFVRQFY